MGRSLPPFLYGPASSHSFYGPTDRPFNPKAVTQASWTRPKPKPKQKGPYVSFNRHPDSYSNFPDGASRWTPMSPSTKGRVFYGRKVQLGLRVLALLGALGSLFCAIVIKNVAVTIIWIVRVGPIVAVLHTLYGIYHLCRSPVSRPAGSQASYMVFAATLDLGLVPYYVFSAYIAYKQITNNAYHWSTLLSADAGITDKIAHSTFILSIVNGSFHLISLCISVWLALIFRQISQLPPDLNPLEDNLTARPHKRNKSEINEKHLSQSTVASATSMEEPLIGPARHVPFMHTRNQSSEDGSSRFSVINEKRRSQQSMYSDRVVPPVPPVPQHSFLAQHDQQASVQSPLADSHNDHTQQVSPDLPDRAQCVSPDSDNWIVYPSRSPSPAEAGLNENLARREPSSAYSQAESLISAGSSFKDWLTSAQRYELHLNEAISEDVRGEYESLALHEHYANDEYIHDIPHVTRLYDNAEQDIGDHNINIFLDHNNRERQFSASLQVNPLALNPPTPQPVQDEINDAPQPPTRAPLTDIPNLAPNPPASPLSPDSPEKKGRFYGELNNKPWLSVARSVSGQNDPDSHDLDRKRSKLVKRNSQKLSTYGSLKQHDADDLDVENEIPPVPTDPALADGDRKGRVVSNSGADIGRHDFGSGSSLAYGNYIANLGVGRRRDVSGKIAEEGRGGVVAESPKQIRAAGWARFAGL
ncbi:hypothetical protein IFM58399_06070 [Aspergillus lentulus]|uniref:Uncharacterized protein n=1 Tax=Aspergillus lentulus TaxID=293939 RepID=A0AAN5YJV5_ASPLE|nr:uncharacterized protein IFM58399_06070 [Aspergillus lentulus]KAF4151598.1 hypothetical protein CNMCM6069_003614 [Aspergillus lentulus]KAF4160284.1 hypothetical protein CNMCM6936_003999 [Aspergillus lentulus]KAF4174002.1 hypothetical protein CNMCM8060_009191 [Aspergillus lentulus]KAF4186478.1 hypothetical protein CNMCM7927_005443 [Aspergillus lentulus]KAF4194033.1 hypothetical protein CNMCM8694_008005 [Aspergillus lentulus]